MLAPTVKLNDGTSMPSLSFGTGTAVKIGGECTELVLEALKNGYTCIDTAQQYGTAGSVGEALKRWGGRREEVYIVTKFGRDGAQPEAIEPRKVLQEQLKLLGVDYVDMYLVHSPLYTGELSLVENWKVMEQLRAEGLCKSIGVSNYREEDLLAIKDVWSVPPAVNQIEFNPYIAHAPNMQRLLKLCKDLDIKVEAYGPLNSVFRSTGGPLDPVVDKIAKAKGATPAQILLRWALQYSGGIAVTTSRNSERQNEQLAGVSTVPALTDDEVEEIAQAGKGRFYRHFQTKVWDSAMP